MWSWIIMSQYEDKLRASLSTVMNKDLPTGRGIYWFAD